MAGGAVAATSAGNRILAGQIAALLAQASPATVPSGILAWWGGRTLPDAAGLAPAITQAEWEALYWIVEGGALAGDSALPQPQVQPLAAIKAATFGVRPDGPLPIAIASFRLAVPTETFMNEIAAAAAAGTGLTSPPANLASVIEEKHVFLAAALMHDQWAHADPVHRGRRITCTLDRQFYISNPGAPMPDAVQVDTGDGTGFRDLAFGSSFVCQCPSGDRATVTIRCRYGTRLVEGRLLILVSDEPAAPSPDETWLLHADPLPDQPFGSTGHSFVYRAAGHPHVVNPLIVAEGFPGGYPSDYLYELLNQHGMLEAWRGAGFDVIILGFDQGSDLIQRSAQVAIACIRRALATATTPLVAGGVSMGGLVMRYALAKMESARMPHHQTRLFFTIDTPHRGAYTVLAAQWFARQFRHLSAGLRTLDRSIDAPANQQFTMLSLVDEGAGVSDLRKQFLADLEKVGGYPQAPRRLAVSCGRGDGVRGTAPVTPMLSWSGPLVAASLQTLPDRATGAACIAEGFHCQHVGQRPASLAVLTDVSWEGVPGGQNTYAAMAAGIAASLGCGDVVGPTSTHGSVPTTSALDLDIDPYEPIPLPQAGRAPFHDYVCSDENQQHLVLTPRVAQWLIERIGTPHTS